MINIFSVLVNTYRDNYQPRSFLVKMPSASLDSGYLLSKFHIEGYTVKSKKKVLPLTDAHFSIPKYNVLNPTTTPNLLLATIPGEGIHLYESSQNQHINSWVVPTDVSLVGPAKMVINGGDSSSGFSSSLNGRSKFEKRLASVSLSETESDNGVESELSSTIDTQNFHLLERGYLLYGVVSKNDNNPDSVWIWSSEGKRSEVKFQEPVFEVYPIGTYDTGLKCMVIFKSGKIAVYGSNLECCLTELNTEKCVHQSFCFSASKDEFSTDFTLDKSGHILLLLCQENTSAFASFYFVDSNTSTFSLLGQNIHIGSSSIFKNSSFSFWNKSSVLVSLDSRSVLRKTTLNPKHSSSIEKTLQLTNLTPSKTYLPSILALSGDHAVILATEHQDDSFKHLMLLWDVQHGAVLQKTVVKEIEFPQTISSFSSHFRYKASLHTQQNAVILSSSYRFSQPDSSGYNVEISVVPFSCTEKSSVLDLIHKHTLTLSYTLETNKEGSTSPGSLPIALADGNVCEVTNFEELDASSCSEISSCSDLEATFFSHLTQFSAHSFKHPKLKSFPGTGLHEELLTKSELKPVSSFIKLDENVHSDSNYSAKVWSQICGAGSFDSVASVEQIQAVQCLSSRYISTIIGRMVKNSDITPDMVSYSSKIMSILLLGTRVFSSMFAAEHGGLLNMLINRHDWPNVQLALVTIPGLAEKELVTVLKHSYTQYSKLVNSTVALVSLKLYLSLVLDYNFDHRILVFSLPSLTESEVSTFLPLLAELLVSYSSVDSLVENGLVMFSKVYNLFSSIIDVHFTFISTSDNLHETIAELRKIIRSRLDSLRSLSQFEPMISAFVSLKRDNSFVKSRPVSGTKKTRQSAANRALDKPYRMGGTDQLFIN